MAALWECLVPVELSDIVMRGECGAESPFWTEDGGFIEVDALPLPPALRDAAERWAVGLDNARADDASEEEEEMWRRAGAELHAQVAAALGPGFTVIYDM